MEGNGSGGLGALGRDFREGGADTLLDDFDDLEMVELPDWAAPDFDCGVDLI